MKVTKAEIVISAVAEAQYPQDDLPEIVLLGRSNVGKSSFINTLINRKGLARTGSQPGKTQTMNFYHIEGSISGTDEISRSEAFRFVDMPGYGYAKVSRSEREKWGKMIETYLLQRENKALVMLLADSRHEPTEDDKLMYDWLMYYGMVPIVVGTKADKISKVRQKKAVENIMRTLGLQQKRDLFLFSAASKIGKDVAWAHIENHLNAYHSREEALE